MHQTRAVSDAFEVTKLKRLFVFYSMSMYVSRMFFTFYVDVVYTCYFIILCTCIAKRVSHVLDYPTMNGTVIFSYSSLVYFLVILFQIQNYSHRIS